MVGCADRKGRWGRVWRAEPLRCKVEGGREGVLVMLVRLGACLCVLSNHVVEEYPC